MRHLRMLTAVISVAILPWSCTGIEDEPISLAQAVGTYDYVTKRYTLEDGQLVYTDSVYDEAGIAMLNETSQGFQVEVDGEVEFRGSKIAAGRNSFTFDIESQQIWVAGQVITITGLDSALPESVKHHGLYESSEKKLTAYYQYDITLIDPYGNIFTRTYVFEFRGTKV